MRRIPYSNNLTTWARELRRDMTPAEVVLWKQVLCKQQLSGTRWHKQRPIDRFIADFYCAALKLVVEVDGGYHERQRERDAARTRVLEGLGLTVVRFTNRQVLEDLEGVRTALEKIVADRSG